VARLVATTSSVSATIQAMRSRICFGLGLKAQGQGA
jgi:hypothetical protein